MICGADGARCLYKPGSSSLSLRLSSPSGAEAIAAAGCRAVRAWQNMLLLQGLNGLRLKDLGFSASAAVRAACLTLRAQEQETSGWKQDSRSRPRQLYKGGFRNSGYFIRVLVKKDSYYFGGHIKGSLILVSSHIGGWASRHARGIRGASRPSLPLPGYEGQPSLTPWLLATRPVVF